MVKINQPKGPLPLAVSVDCPNIDCGRDDFIEYRLGYETVHIEHRVDCDFCGAPIKFKIKMVPVAVGEEVVWNI